jgi:hypothetical protein
LAIQPATSGIQSRRIGDLVCPVPDSITNTRRETCIAIALIISGGTEFPISFHGRDRSPLNLKVSGKPAIVFSSIMVNCLSSPLIFGLHPRYVVRIAGLGSEKKIRAQITDPDE